MEHGRLVQSQKRPAAPARRLGDRVEPGERRGPGVRRVGAVDPERAAEIGEPGLRGEAVGGPRRPDALELLRQRAPAGHPVEVVDHRADEVGVRDARAGGRARAVPAGRRTSPAWRRRCRPRRRSGRPGRARTGPGRRAASCSRPGRSAGADRWARGRGAPRRRDRGSRRAPWRGSGAGTGWRRWRRGSAPGAAHERHPAGADGATQEVHVARRVRGRDVPHEGAAALLAAPAEGAVALDQADVSSGPTGNDSAGLPTPAKNRSSSACEPKHVTAVLSPRPRGSQLITSKRSRSGAGSPATTAGRYGLAAAGPPGLKNSVPIRRDGRCARCRMTASRIRAPPGARWSSGTLAVAQPNRAWPGRAPSPARGRARRRAPRRERRRDDRRRGQEQRGPDEHGWSRWGRHRHGRTYSGPACAAVDPGALRRDTQVPPAPGSGELRAQRRQRERGLRGVLARSRLPPPGARAPAPSCRRSGPRMRTARRSELDLLDPARGLGADVVVVVGLAADDRAETRDAGVAARLRQVRRASGSSNAPGTSNRSRPAPAAANARCAPATSCSARS